MNARIPEDWVPWVEMAKDHMSMQRVIAAAHRHDRKLGELIGVCLSAAKWIVGDPWKIGIVGGSTCGCCHQARKVADTSACSVCVLRAEGLDIMAGMTCVDHGHVGDIMALYERRLTPRLKRAWKALQYGRKK